MQIFWFALITLDRLNEQLFILEGQLRGYFNWVENCAVHVIQYGVPVLCVAVRVSVMQWRMFT